MMKRLMLALAAVLGVSLPASAQATIDTGTITAVSSGGACSAAPAGCAVFQLPNGVLTSLTLQVSGTYSATLAFEATSDNVTWFAISATKLADGSNATTTTGTGQFAIANSGLVAVRVRCTAFTSGTATITAVRGYARPVGLAPFLLVGNFGDGSAAAPSVTFANNTDRGFFNDTSNSGIGFSVAGAQVGKITAAGIFSKANTPGAISLGWLGVAGFAHNSGDNGVSVITNNAENHYFGTNTAGFFTRSDYPIGWSSTTNARSGAADLFLFRDAPGILALKNGATAQTFRVYQTTTGSVRAEINAAVAPVTAAASVAAGGTVNLNSDITRTRYQVTVAPAAGDCATAFNAAALTADCTIATLPAGMKLVGVYADVTAGFTCSGTCTGTKTIGAGVTAGGVTILAAGLSVTATATFGLADADLGTSMVRAAQIQGGYTPSWSATSPVIVRFTSGTGNWGNGAATFVNAGTVKFTLITEQVK